MRYGVAIARGKLYEPGTYTIKRKVRWPHWQPTQNMIDRDPELYADIADGMEPGPENALGSRAQLGHGDAVGGRHRCDGAGRRWWRRAR